MTVLVMNLITYMLSYTIFPIVGEQSGRGTKEL